MYTDEVRLAVLAWQHEHPAENMLIGARARAKTRDLVFEITADDISAVYPADGLCYICGVTMQRNLGGKGPRATSPAIDRIDNGRGYEPGNVHVICMRDNSAKQDHTLAELAHGCDRHKSCGADRPALRSWARRHLSLAAAG